MAQRYRTFKRVPLTRRSAQKMVELLVDRTLEDHMRRCHDHRGNPLWDEANPCSHMGSGSLGVARLVESGMTIGKKRARLDIEDDPEVARKLSERLTLFAPKAKSAAPAFHRAAEIALQWATRSPLERLAECGLELDDDAFQDED